MAVVYIIGQLTAWICVIVIGITSEYKIISPLLEHRIDHEAERIGDISVIEQFVRDWSDAPFVRIEIVDGLTCQPGSDAVFYKEWKGL